MKKTLHWLFWIATAIGATALLFAPLVAVSNELPQGVLQEIDTRRAANIVNFEWLTELGRPGLVCVLIFVVSYAVRRVEQLSNRWLWLLVPIGTATFAAIGERMAVDAVENGVLKTVVGAIISITTILAVILTHDKIFVMIARKFPPLAFIVAEDVRKE